MPKELRTRRIALGLSLEELGRLLGADPFVLSAMESGDVPITLTIIGALSHLEQKAKPKLD